jgi:hypothetical protein
MLVPTLLLTAALFAPVPSTIESSFEGQPGLRVEDHRWRRTITLDLGPITIPTSSSYYEPAAPVTAAATWGVNGWLKGFRMEMVDARGRPLDVPVLHHAALIAPGDRDLFGPMARRIVAFGQETAPIPFPRGLGYRVHPGDSLRLVAVLYNPLEVPIDGVRLRMTVDYALDRLDGERFPVLPFLMNAAGKRGYEFDVPPGGAQQSWEWSPVVSGSIIALGGHLHTHAVAVLLEDVTEGKLLWRGEAIYGADGEIEGVTRKGFLRMPRMRPDHVYRVTAVYENPTGETIRGAMGHVGGLFIPDRGAIIPAPDRGHSDYLADENISLMGEHVHHHPD